MCNRIFHWVLQLENSKICLLTQSFDKTYLFTIWLNGLLYGYIIYTCSWAKSWMPAIYLDCFRCRAPLWLTFSVSHSVCPSVCSTLYKPVGPCFQFKDPIRLFEFQSLVHLKTFIVFPLVIDIPWKPHWIGKSVVFVIFEAEGRNNLNIGTARGK